MWETMKCLQDKEREWEEEKKLLMTHIEMLKSTQGMVMMSEEPREEKNKGKLEESSAKANFQVSFQPSLVLIIEIYLTITKHN